VKLLLINPRFPESFWSFKWAVDSVLPGKRAVNPPLGLATVAALTPAEWDVQIVDENIESIPLKPVADIIGICGMGVQFPRQSELLAYYRQRGYYVVAGGSFASLCPEEYASIADSVVAGEAEYIWPRFCADFEAGAPKALYGDIYILNPHGDVMERAIAELRYPARNNAGPAAFSRVGLINEQRRIAGLTVDLSKPVFILQQFRELIIQTEELFGAPIDIIGPERQVIGKRKKADSHVV
jgi:radical SAM superfamily enzyme YgiQ (UPF0313 family)